jgi:tRNA modification GTPase
LDENDDEIIELIKDKKVIALLNKSDMETVVDKDKLQGRLKCTVLSVSAKNSLGIDELETAVKEMFFEGNISFNEEIYITNARHKQLLTEAKTALLLVRDGIESQMSEDFLTIDMMTAYEKLGLIIGEEVEDDLADNIFKKFCMGK